MRVLFVVNKPDFFLSHRREIGEALLEMGHEVHVLAGAPAPDISHSPALRFHQYRNPKPSINVLREVSCLISMFKGIKQVRPDVVHLLTLKPHLYGMIACRSLSIPTVVIAIAGLGNLKSGKSGRVLAFFVALMYRVVCFGTKFGVVVQNTRDRQFALRVLKVEEKYLRLTRGSGVNLSHYQPGTNFKTNSLRCLFAGRLLKAKGVLDFIEIAGKCRQANVEFVIAGGIDENNSDSLREEEVERLSRAQNNITVLGFVQDMSELLSSVDLMIYPSKYGEGVPKVLLEAAASGVPIVTFDTPGCEDAVVDGETGFVCSQDSEGDLEDKVALLLRDHTLRQAFAVAARRYAEQYFDVQAVVDSNLSLYASLRSVEAG